MAVSFYMDHHVPRCISVGLHLRGLDVVTAFDDGAHELGDTQLLDRAGELGRVLFTQDDDLLTAAAKRQRNGISFGGLIYAHQLRVSIGTCIEHLEIIGKAAEPEDMAGKVIFLPL